MINVLFELRSKKTMFLNVILFNKVLFLHCVVIFLLLILLFLEEDFFFINFFNKHYKFKNLIEFCNKIYYQFLYLINKNK